MSAGWLTDHRTQVGDDRGFGVKMVIRGDLAVLNKRFPVNRVSQFGRHFAGPGESSGFGNARLGHQQILVILPNLQVGTLHRNQRLG